jgi:hypothetical protein
LRLHFWSLCKSIEEWIREVSVHQIACYFLLLHSASLDEEGESEPTVLWRHFRREVTHGELFATMQALPILSVVKGRK